MIGPAASTCNPAIARSSAGAGVYLVRAMAVFGAFLVYSALSVDLISIQFGLGAYSALLLIYLLLEMKNLRSHASHLFWINPIVLASIFTFAAGFGISNIIYFMPEDMVATVGRHQNVTSWMNLLMFLVVLAACGMWMGYSSSLGRNIGKILHGNILLRKWMSTSDRVNMPALYTFLVISLVARLVEIKLGVYGYSSTYDQLMAAASYREYLSMAESMGRLALVGVALQCFSSSRASFADRKLLWLVCGYEVAFGFLSGFKSAVVMPFITLGIVYYGQRMRFPRWLVPLIFGAAMAAYAVIEPFRVARNADAGFSGTSVGNIASTLSGGLNSQADGPRASTALSVLYRMNMTHISSLGFEYAANNELPIGSPKFLADIMLSPAHALVPRLLWKEKSMQNIGLWYTREVVGHQYFSSTAMSPFTYLNFAGGPLAVIIGFVVVGVLQRGLFEGLRGFGGGGLFVLFGLLGTLSIIDSAFNTFFIGIVRLVPFFVAAQYLLLQRSPRPCAE